MKLIIPDSNPISQRPTLITEIDFSKKNISQQPDPPTVCESQSQEDERQISSHGNQIIIFKSIHSEREKKL